MENWWLVDRVRAGVKKRSEGILTPAEVREVRRSGAELVRHSGESVSTDIPAAQPFGLRLWAALLTLVGDSDADLPDILGEGVSMGRVRPNSRIPREPTRGTG